MSDILLTKRFSVVRSSLHEGWFIDQRQYFRDMYNTIYAYIQINTQRNHHS